MSNVLNLADNGAGSAPMVGVMDNMMGGVLPTSRPADTSFSIGRIDSAGPNDMGPTDALARAITSSLTPQANRGQAPFQQEISSDLAPFFTGMAFQDTSHQSTDEGLNDQQLENPVFASPWEDGSDQLISQYDPLFIYNVDKGTTSQGFEVVATPAMINQIQAKLFMKTAQANLYGTTQPNQRRRRKRVRLYDVNSRNSVPATSLPQLIDSHQLDSLRFYGGLTPQELYAKINYAGPVTKVIDSTGFKPVGMIRKLGVNERLINHSYYSRGKIQNMFGEELRAGDALYFTIANYSQEQLLSYDEDDNVQRPYSRKRHANGSAVSRHATMVGSHGTSEQQFTQVRGWSSHDGQEYLGMTEPAVGMKPAAYDRFYCDRMRRAAVEFVDIEFDQETGKMRTVDTLASEGLQEAVANLPDVVIENYLTPGIVIPVGVVKQRLNKKVTKQAILNAHYDQTAMSLLPHVEIVQNRI